MLKKVEVKHPGDSEFLLGEVIDLLDINNINKDLVEKGKKPGINILTGLNKDFEFSEKTKVEPLNLIDL